MPTVYHTEGREKMDQESHGFLEVQSIFISCIKAYFNCDTYTWIVKSHIFLGYNFLKNNIFIGFVVLELAQFLLKYLLRCNKIFNCDF